MNRLPPQQLVIRIGQFDSSAQLELEGVLPVDGLGRALHRLVEGRMLVCAAHLAELAKYRPGLESRVVLTVEQVDSLVMEFGLRRDDVMLLHGPDDPLLGEGRCRMCETQHVEGNLCHRDDCGAPLHPQWPAVYCSIRCADVDA